MCILCVASRWSRRIVTLLPWLVIPFIMLWALSQLLPPSFRFEITSPRLACLAVLLVSLGWYELAMPKLSAWRARRRALLREKRRVEAQEIAKWRKEATRRCRNCNYPYKDQTPGGGRFMCTNCGHVSKRPVLEIPGGGQTMGSSFSLAGSAIGLLNTGGISASRNSRIWNGRGPQDRSTLGAGRGWAGGKPWIDGSSWNMNSAWFGGSWPGNSIYFGMGSGWSGPGAFLGNSIFGGERCSAGESYFGVFWFLFRILSQLILFVGWTLRKLWRAGYDGEDDLDGVHGSCHARGEDTGSSHETRWEKARRKAEEKRLARLEKEQLEAEERKQREEVARLVEERRRKRDEKLEVEKESERQAAAEKEREIRREREAERRKQEKAREKDKAYMKDKLKDQDMDELRKRKGKETEKKADVDKSKNEEMKPVMKIEVTSKGTDMGMKANVMTKSMGAKNLGSAKSCSIADSKTAAISTNSTSFWRRRFSSKSSNNAGKSSKTVMSATSSIPSTSNASSLSSGGGKTEVSVSAWNKIHWTNVWGKATKKTPVEDSKASEGVSAKTNDTAKNTEVMETMQTFLNTENNEDIKDLFDGSVISISTVSTKKSREKREEGVLQGTVSKQPIAPPSNRYDSWDNLFSGPICFPPVELPVDSGFQDQGADMHEVPYVSPSSLLTAESYFGDTGLPCTQVSCTYSDANDSAASSSLPPSVSSSLNMIDFAGEDISDSFSALDPLAESLIPNPTVDLGMNLKLSPVSPLSVAGTMRTPMQDTASQMLDPWNADSNDSRWNDWKALNPQLVNFSNGSLWDPQFQHVKDKLQPFSTNLRESSFNLVPPPASSFFSSGQKDSLNASYVESCYNHIYSGKNWQNRSAMDSMMHVWDDADMNQIVPPEFVDCITHSLMQDPVITADGHSYERSAIEAWLKFHDTSPKTGEVLPPPPGDGTGVDKTLRPNHILRGQIIEYMEHLARGMGLHECSNSSSVWRNNSAGESSSLWSSEGSTTIRQPMRGFYPTTGKESVWSYSVTGN